ncbi:hypothetical protein EYZ11_004962 [Aspergillus tanneri]|uniref:DUF7728 domain-containing protein n=1 Tax=Aspergillus tanneri TaxID=1220188 RepID=A0A4S3JLF7_9EURO|nr:uncharacterized protein ATNIH1004_010741 [Aspergillus tanneri]KAA8641802.1 hypothetical protein ATNIH1004_010741 [Aspergillus tanneri]THC95537.1 hypothetical protein EYZ11_004962 [Aspergillus tanneri]
MILRPFLVGTAVALGANAFLLVPEAEVEAEIITPQDDLSLRPLEAVASSQHEVILGCTECPFREVGENGKVGWTDGFDTSLSLKFSVENGFLLANGRPIFPPPPPTHLTAIQRRLSDGAESGPIELGYAVEMMPIPTPPDEPMDMVSVRFTILDLESHPVPIDTVALHLIHDSAANLYLAGVNIEETAPSRVSWRQCHGRAKCLRRLLFARIRSMFAAAKMRLLGLRAGSDCGAGSRGLGHPHHGSHHDGFSGPHSTWTEGDMERPPRPPHHHHMHLGHWERTLSRVVRFIVIPAVLGVLAGLAASALGMLVGQIVVFLWQRFRRSSPKKSEEQGTGIEKQGLMTDSTDDLPPAYTDEEALPEVVSADNN